MIINFNNLGASGGGSGSGSTVSWRQDLTAGTQIAQITINGTPQNVYAPSGGSGSDIIQNYQIVSALTDVQGEESTSTLSGYTFDFSAATTDSYGLVQDSEYNLYVCILDVIDGTNDMGITDPGFYYCDWNTNPAIPDDNQGHSYTENGWMVRRNGYVIDIVSPDYSGEEIIDVTNAGWEPSAEIVTGTTSDTIVAVVVLEGTVAYVTADGKFYQHLDNDWVEMPDTSAAQIRYTVSSTTEMNSLEAKEGDICVVNEPAGSADITEALYWLVDNFGLKDAVNIASESALGRSASSVTFEVVQNPYQTEGSVTSAFLSMYDNGHWVGLGVDVNNLVADPRFLVSWSSDNDWQIASVGMTLTVGDWNNFANWASQNGRVLFLEESNYWNPYVFRATAETASASTTYQYNKGQWIELATLADVSSAMTQANQAYSLAQSKLSDSSVQISTWGDFEYYGNGVYSTQVNGADEGVRLHIMGAKTNYTNPRINQIVTSDSFLRIMKMTQDEYDNLQTKDSNVCYIIVEEE